jgi:hypothetical protein
MKDPIPLLLDGIIVPAFVFDQQGGVVISYKGVTYAAIPADSWYMWYTYTDRGSLYFHVQKMSKGAQRISYFYNNDKIHNSLTLDPPAGDIHLIGTGDVHASGPAHIDIDIDIHNRAAYGSAPTAYAVIKISRLNIIITTP